MAEPTLHPPDFSSYLDQSQSPLFSILPAEIRSEIFTYALSGFEDTGRLYSRETYWTRPGYSAPHRTCTDLLRTCKRVYLESWFMPFACAEHAFYLTARDRAPGQLPRDRFAQFLKIIHDNHGEVETGRIRIFAQLYMLEPGGEIGDIMNMKHFHPRSITVTLRYTDFWHWEENAPLYVDSKWVNVMRLPDSVTSFTVDFESLERRKAEVDIISTLAAESWFFQRDDGAVLTAKRSDIKISTWTGSSMLGSARWIKYEARPGQLDYYIASVTWHLDSRPEVDWSKPRPELTLPQDFVQVTPPPTPWITIGERDMRSVGIRLDTPVEQAIAAVRNHRRRRLGLAVEA
ncbi:hypothetical protein ARAM_003757 [Aspergillus rambellii]|uniref:Uncharacterized protein n=1 Tax=Aspergillus rambellii TaxID=308745 RepID=A0A0F8UBI9_9EURO|nr:hypothetical protein ARAM_003757 [Aspergillus rambellii]